MKSTPALLLAMLFLLSACAPQAAEASAGACPVTQAPFGAFAFPESYDGQKTAPNPGMFWYGDPALWTMLSADGTWESLPRDEHGYTQKIFWWAEGYVWNEEPLPEFLLSAERLDGKGAVIESREATNAYTNESGSSILTGILIPEAGCWQISGHYRGHELSFVVEVKP